MMNRMSSIGRSVLVLVAGLILGLGAPARGDTRIVVREGTSLAGSGEELPEGLRESLAGQEPKTVTYWFGDDRSARVDETSLLIARLDRGESYFVNRLAKSYQVIELPSGEGAESLRGAWEMTESDETRQIGSWTARRHDMTIEMGDEPIQVTLWVADIGIDLDAFHAFVEAVAEAQGIDWMRAYLDLDGYPVRQEVSIGGMLSWQEVQSVTEGPAPPGTYEVPAGFSEKE